MRTDPSPSTTALPSRVATVLLVLAAAAGTMGANGCPLFPDSDTSTTDEGSATTSADVDIGGVGGATWKLVYDDTILVTLHEGGKAAATKMKASVGGLFSLLGNTVDLTAFCWRMDTVCPSQVLTSKTSVIQPASTPDRFVIGFNRRGPLAGVKQTGLIGALDHRNLDIPLGGAANGKADPCVLVQGSAILATAAPADSVTDAGVDSAVADAGIGDGGESPERAETLKGQVTLGFKGSCFSLTTGSAVAAKAVVSLSTTFMGTRLD